MIDRRLLAGATKDVLLEAGFKLANQLQDGDRIYGIAVGKNVSYSETPVPKIELYETNAKVNIELGYYRVRESSSYPYFYYFGRNISSGSLDLFSLILGSVKLYTTDTFTSMWRSGFGAGVMIINNGYYYSLPQTYRTDGTYYFHYLYDCSVVYNGTQITNHASVKYKGGANTITDQVLFLTEAL